MDDLKIIAIVDDDEAVRDSTAELLKSSSMLVRLFEDGSSFLLDDLADISCILLDMRMPGLDGMEVLKQLGERDSFPPVVVLTGHGDVALAVEAMKRGAVEFIEKPYEPALLLSSLAAAMRMREPARPKLPPSTAALALIGKLSGRQQEVLIGMLGGEPNKIMAWKLGLSIRTVEAHRAQVMARLQVRSIAEAVQIALSAGLKAASA